MTLTIPKRSALDYKWALITWVLAYVTIAAAGTGGYFLVTVIRHTRTYAGPTQDPSYLLEEKFLPLANLVVWTVFALVYFAKRRAGAQSRFTEPLRLGALWLAIALPVDFLAFVVIKSPEAMTAPAFYIGQFPWIYLIYTAVFLSPACAAALRLWLRPAAATRTLTGPRPPASTARAPGNGGIPPIRPAAKHPGPSARIRGTR